MSEQTPESASGSLSLPDAPNLDWLRKQAKHNLETLRSTKPDAKLADAQFELAKRYGFPSWRALKTHIDSLTIDGQLFDAARKGDVDKLTTLLDTHPDRLYARTRPYEHTLLHLAAHNGHLGAVDFLLKRGIDVNTREKGDNTYAMLMSRRPRVNELGIFTEHSLQCQNVATDDCIRGFLEPHYHRIFFLEQLDVLQQLRPALERV